MFSYYDEDAANSAEQSVTLVVGGQPSGSAIILSLQLFHLLSQFQPPHLGRIFLID